MSWIKTINYEQASGALRKIYDRIKGPNDNVDNVLLIHSLRPHTLVGHMTLYKNVLHNSSNTVPKWYLEALGVYVSHLNKCTYCFEHHFAGFSRIYPSSDADTFRLAVLEDAALDFFKGKYKVGILYAHRLTTSLETITASDIEKLRTAGFDDGQILEINQVVSYFNYVNRSVVGLGVGLKGDVLGLSPNDSSDPTNWNHD